MKTFTLQARGGFAIRDGSLRLPASPRVGFPQPAMVVGRGHGKILVPHHRAGWGWV